MAQLNPFQRLKDVLGNNRTTTGVVLPFERPERLTQPSPVNLARLIEGEIIPRLLLAHARDDAEPATAVEAMELDVAEFAQRVLTEDLRPLLTHVQARIDAGVSVAAICLDLLSPTAKLLGELWEEDLCTFADVTVGLCRLQQIVYEMGDRIRPTDVGQWAPRALFAMVPGDQHSFGLVMVAEFFRRAGWNTVVASDATADDLLDMASTEAFDVIGFSVSDGQWLPQMPALISALRAASRNQSVKVMAGGRIFSERPDLVSQVGADETAVDAEEAVKQAAKLVGQATQVQPVA